MNDSIAQRLRYLEKVSASRPIQKLGNTSSMAQGTRSLLLWALIGANRTGKTSTLVGMIKAWRAANPGRKVIAFDPQSFLQQAGLVDVIIPLSRMETWAKELCEKNGEQYKGLGGSKEFKYGDALLVLDDFRKLHPWHQLNIHVLGLLGERTKMNLDILYCVWNPKNLLDQMAGFTNRYSIFYTMSEQGGFSDKIPNAIPCMKASRIINEYVKHYNLLDDAKRREIYPKFPYIIVYDDYETKATCVNIEEKKLAEIYRLKKVA